MKAPTAVVEVLLPLRNKTSQQVEDFLKNELQRKGKGSLPVNKSVGGFSAPFLISTPHDITPMDFQASKRSHKKTQTPNSRKCRITNMLTQSVLILTVPLHCTLMPAPYIPDIRLETYGRYYLYEIGFLTVAGGLSMT